VLPDGLPFSVNGREAETLLALTAAGPRGLTSLEAFRAGWAVRLAAYIHDLKHDFGVPIVATREEHDGGSHARYFLVGRVEVLKGLPAVPKEEAA
jgi:hypothetical protein